MIGRCNINKLHCNFVCFKVEGTGANNSLAFITKTDDKIQILPKIMSDAFYITLSSTMYDIE